MMKILDDIELGEPIFLRNLSIYAISGYPASVIQISSLEEVLSIAHGEFRELDPPDINRIAFHNQGNAPLLMLDGEEIIGSLQNRIAVDSILVPARTRSNIPVICAEEGRWVDIGSFQTGYFSYPGIRAILSRRGREKNGLQKKVWKEIDRKLTATKTLSTTSSMHDIYNNLDDEVNRYVEDFKDLNHDTIGFVGVAGGKILGCDMFHDPATYRKFEQKLMRSYALDAIEHRKSSPNGIDVRRFLRNIETSLNDGKFTSKTRHFSLKERNFSGQGLLFNDRLIHLSVFPR
jgi:hypothetical protein